MPYKIHTVVTDNSTHFITLGDICPAAPEIRITLDYDQPLPANGFDVVCA